MTAAPPRFDDRLVAEAVRVHEDRLGHPLDEPDAWRHAAQVDGDLEARLVARAGATGLGRRVGETLGEWRGNLATLLTLAFAFAALAGVLAAVGVFGVPGAGGGEVNVFVVITGLLGIQLLMLAAWLAMALARPGRGGGWLGARLVRLIAWFSRRLSRDDPRSLLAAALVRLTGTRRLGTWTASALTHVLWAAFCVGALIACMLILAVRQYDFVWGTTLLEAPHFVRLVGWLGVGPSLLGFPVPDEALVRASRLGAEAGIETRRAWAGLVLGALLVYGLVPRLLLALGCAALARRAASRFRLDLSASAYALAAPRVMPAARRIGVVDADTATAADEGADVIRRRSGDVGVVAIALLEPDPDRETPEVDAATAWLGIADDRGSRAAVVERVSTLDPKPRVVVVVAPLVRTPDRGARAFLRRLRDATRAPVWLLLDPAGAGDYGVRVEDREADWQRLAAGAAVDRVLTSHGPGDAAWRESIMQALEDEAGAGS